MKRRKKIKIGQSKEDRLPARFFLVVDPAVLLQRGVDHLPKALHQAAHGRLQPAGVGVEEDDGAKTTQLTFLLKEIARCQSANCRCKVS